MLGLVELERISDFSGIRGNNKFLEIIYNVNRGHENFITCKISIRFKYYSCENINISALRIVGISSRRRDPAEGSRTL